jgi:hypothetical protein
VFVVLALVGAGCGVADMPDDPTARSCLRAAGVEPDRLDGADERRQAFAEHPGSLDCVAEMLAPSDREAVLRGVYEDQEEFWPVLTAYVDSLGDRGREKIADSAGRLLAAVDGADGDDGPDDRWRDEAVDHAVAVAALVHQDGLPESFGVWQEEAGRDATAREIPSYDDCVAYAEWTETGDPAVSAQLDELQDWVRRARG